MLAQIALTIVTKLNKGTLMPLKRKVRKLGNSVAFPVPNEVFEFLNFDPKNVKYKLIQDETGNVYLVILDKDVFALDEKNFQKLRSLYGFILPKSLCIMWNIGTNETNNRDIEISYTDSPRKWLIKPAV